MKKSVNALLRERIDPDRILPFVSLVTDHGENIAGLTGYRALANSRNIGTVLLRRAKPEVGRATLQIEELRVARNGDPAVARNAIELAILTRSNIESRVLISDAHGVTFEETAMWYRLAGSHIATIVQPFMPRTQLMQGEAVYDGQAFAPPLALDEQPTLIS